MRWRTILVGALSAGLSLVMDAQTLVPMNDDEMAQVTGREGVQLTLRLRNNVSESGVPVGCSGLLNPCRMGIEFAGRSGIWLMLKDYYGTLEINDIRLESSYLPAVGTAYQDTSRFLSTDLSSCLVPGCNPSGMSALKVTYPFSKGVGEYEDIKLFVNIGRVALEFDDSGVPGYLRDVAAGSVLGFRATDSTALNAPAQFRVDGVGYVFGF